MAFLGEETSVREVRERELIESVGRHEEQLERIAELVIESLGVENVLIGIFEQGNQRIYYDHEGIVGEDGGEESFCDHAVREEEIQAWSDLREDSDFESHPLVVGAPHLRSCLAAPLEFGDGHAAGALCAMNSEPREWTDRERSLLARFASSVVDAVELRVATRRLDRANLRLEALFEAAPMGTVLLDDEARVIRWNRLAKDVLGVGDAESEEARIPAASGESTERFEAGVRRVVESGEPVEMEIGISVRDGDERICAISLAPVRSEVVDDVEIVGAVQDVTERRLREARLRKSEERFRRIFEEAGIGMALVDLDRTLIEVNQELGEMLGYDPEELEGRKFDEVTHPEDLEADAAQFEALTEQNDRSYQLEKRYIRKDGSVMWGNLTVSVIEDEHGEMDYMVGMVEDITARKQAENELMYRAKHDSLTELHNRDAFEEALEGALADATRTWAVLFVDLDRFKEVNDTLGHTAGDEVLTIVAERLERAIREEDLVARMGGDEFGFLLRSVDNREETVEVVERLHETLEQPISVEGETFDLSASTGIVMGDDSYREPDDVLRAADAAMYGAKREARGRWLFAGEEL